MTLYSSKQPMNYVEPTRLCVPSKQVVNQESEKDMQKKNQKNKKTKKTE